MITGGIAHGVFAAMMGGIVDGNNSLPNDLCVKVEARMDYWGGCPLGSFR